MDASRDKERQLVAQRPPGSAGPAGRGFPDSALGLVESCVPGSLGSPGSPGGQCLREPSSLVSAALLPCQYHRSMTSEKDNPYDRRETIWGPLRAAASSAVWAGAPRDPLGWLSNPPSPPPGIPAPGPCDITRSYQDHPSHHRSLQHIQGQKGGAGVCPVLAPRANGRWQCGAAERTGSCRGQSQHRLPPQAAGGRRGGLEPLPPTGRLASLFPDR